MGPGELSAIAVATATATAAVTTTFTATAAADLDAHPLVRGVDLGIDQGLLLLEVAGAPILLHELGGGGGGRGQSQLRRTRRRGDSQTKNACRTVCGQYKAVLPPAALPLT